MLIRRCKLEENVPGTTAVVGEIPNDDLGLLSAPDEVAGEAEGVFELDSFMTVSLLDSEFELSAV